MRAGDLVLVAGTTAIDEDGIVRGIGDAGAQTAFVLERIAGALRAAGARMDQVVQTRMFVTDISRAEEIGRAHGAASARIRRSRRWSQVAGAARSAHARGDRGRCATSASSALQGLRGSVRPVAHTAPLVIVAPVLPASR